MVSWASLGHWGTSAGLVVSLFVSLVRGWLVPRSHLTRLFAQQQQITELTHEALLRERERADLQERDLIALMRQLTAALERSQPMR